MLPDYIIYDELKKERERRERRDDRPQIEIPMYMPYGPESEYESPAEHGDESDGERGVTIIQI